MNATTIEAYALAKGLDLSLIHIYSVFTGTGSYVPTKQIKNDFFHSNEFYDSTGKKLDTPNEEITRKFEEITTIAERRYAEDDQVTSDLALIASNKAIESAGIDLSLIHI